MHAWRIGTDTPDYVADDISGAGARVAGGRWHRKGTPVVYAASSIALACLETIVHFGVSDLPLNRYLVEIEIPDDLLTMSEVFNVVRNVGWDALPAGKVSLDVGETWVKANASAVMIVPSVIVPEERNFLINPMHPHATRIRARKVRRWTYDSRLVRSGR